MNFVHASRDRRLQNSPITKSRSLARFATHGHKLTDNKTLFCHFERRREISELHPWHILPLICYRVFFLQSLITHFLTQKVPKTSAHGKNSHPFLGSGVAKRHTSVEKSLPLNLFFCFTALRNLGGKALLRKYNAPHGKQSSLSSVKQKSLSCVFQRCRFAFGDGLLLLVQINTVPPF